MKEPSRLPIGVCTWTFGSLSLPEIAMRSAALGLDGVELLGDLSLYSAKEARDILASTGLDIFSLTPADADLAHPDAAVRKEGVDYFLRLLDFAAELGQPLVSCHGLVGRVTPLSDMTEEMSLLAACMRTIAQAAAARDLRIVFEVLNRYETHTVCTGMEALEFLHELGEGNVGVLLDAYHMNIEEADPAGTIREVGSRLWLYHAADSNRQAIGRGHTDFTAQLTALQEVGYTGPVILECTAPGPNPFTPMKDAGSLASLEMYLNESIAWLRKKT